MRVLIQSDANSVACAWRSLATASASSLSLHSFHAGQVSVTEDMGLVSRASSVHTVMRNYTGDEGRSFEFDNQVLISSHRKLLWSKAMVVNVAEKSGQDSGRQG